MLNRVLLDRDPTCYHEDGKIDFRNYFIGIVSRLIQFLRIRAKPNILESILKWFQICRIRRFQEIIITK